MSLLEDLRWRYATKKMSGARVPADKLAYILEAARLAPSSSGLQPYKILVLRDRRTRAKNGTSLPGYMLFITVSRINASRCSCLVR